ncbi:hypothetical protein POX46_21790, partial [Escherichia coli]
LKTSIKIITYLSDIGCLEIQGASLLPPSAFKKTDMTVGFIFIAKMHTVHAGCGVNALSGLHNLAKSIYCTIFVDQISVAHQAI